MNSALTRPNQPVLSSFQHVLIITTHHVLFGWIEITLVFVLLSSSHLCPHSSACFSSTRCFSQVHAIGHYARLPRPSA